MAPALRPRRVCRVPVADNREVLEYDVASGAIQLWHACRSGSNNVLRARAHSISLSRLRKHLVAYPALRAAYRAVGSIRTHGLPARLWDSRVKSNFSSRINVIWVVESHLKKYSGFPKSQISFITPAVLSFREGRWPSSRTLGRDAVDASSAQDESADLADGEVVWS